MNKFPGDLGKLTSGVSRISARGVLKVRPDTESGGGGGGAFRIKWEGCVYHCCNSIL